MHNPRGLQAWQQSLGGRQHKHTKATQSPGAPMGDDHTFCISCHAFLCCASSHARRPSCHALSATHRPTLRCCPPSAAVCYATQSPEALMHISPRLWPLTCPLCRARTSRWLSVGASAVRGVMSRLVTLRPAGSGVEC